MATGRSTHDVKHQGLAGGGTARGSGERSLICSHSRGTSWRSRSWTARALTSGSSSGSCSIREGARQCGEAVITRIIFSGQIDSFVCVSCYTCREKRPSPCKKMQIFEIHFSLVLKEGEKSQARSSWLPTQLYTQLPLVGRSNTTLRTESLRTQRTATDLPIHSTSCLLLWCPTPPA